MSRIIRRIVLVLTVSLIFVGAYAQSPSSGSRNVEVVSSIPWPEDQRLEFRYVAVEEARPKAYVSDGSGVLVFDLGGAPDFSGRIDLPVGKSAREISTFEIGGKSYLAIAYRVASGSGGVVLADVTGSPEIVRDLEANAGGYDRLFAYKHSSGQELLFAAGDRDLDVIDLATAIGSGGANSFVRSIPSPEVPDGRRTGIHQAFAGYHPGSDQDRLYIAGAGGYQVLDITDIRTDSVLVAINPAGIEYGHGIVPTPQGTSVVTAPNYRLAPIRVFDLTPVFDGTVPRLRTAAGAWATDWCNYAQNFEVRWPYTFVAAMENGFQMFNMRDLDEIYTTAFYNTSSAEGVCNPNTPNQGAFDIAVRNADGLILVSDLESGLWLLRVEAFDNWDGRGWGVPNVSTAQDWLNGPRNMIN